MLDLQFRVSADTTKSITSAARRRLQARTRGCAAPPARSASEDGRGGAAAPRLELEDISQPGSVRERKNR